MTEEKVVAILPGQGISTSFELMRCHENYSEVPAEIVHAAALSALRESIPGIDFESVVTRFMHSAPEGTRIHVRAMAMHVTELRADRSRVMFFVTATAVGDPQPHIKEKNSRKTFVFLEATASVPK